MKIWYFLCILFCVYSINILIGERYEITYTLDERSEIEQVEHLICMNLNDEKSPFSNQIELRPSELDKLLKLFEFKGSKRKDLHLIESYKKMILDPIRSRNFLIYLNKVCILPNETGIEQQQLNVIQHAMDKTSKLSRYAFNKDTKNLIELRDIWQKVNQLIVFNLEHPYSNCTDQNYRKLDCLNKCFKKKNRISKYLYEEDDTVGSIRLNYDDKNASLSNDEKGCFLECKYDDCKFVHFNNTRPRSRPLIFRANPIISPSNYWIQLIGLLFFFANVNLFQILSEIIEIIKSKVQNQKIKKVLFYSQPAILTICLIYCLYVFIELILGYQNASRIPIKKRTTVNLLEPESFSMFICVDMNNILTKDFKNTRFKMNYFENKTLSVLENESASAFNETVDEIYLQFQNKQMPVDWKLIPKVLFKKSGTFYRCFQVEIYPFEPRYQSLLAITKLVVRFQHSRYYIYLEPEDKNFNSETFPFVGSYSFRKSIYKKSNKRAQCLNYDDKLHCNNYFDCLDRCIARRFVKKYKNITCTFGGIINKDHFVKEEWTKFYLDENHTKYSEILKECKEEAKIYDCLKMKFEKDVQINQPNRYIRELDLYYDVMKLVEEEPSIYKLLLDMLNIQSVLLGLNIFKLQIMAYSWLTVRTKFKHYLLIVIYLTCLFGFTYQTYYIIDEIVNGELTDSEYYEVSKSLNTPEVIFCFKFDLLSIDKNHKLNGNYLDQLTQHINLNTVFKEITYLNKSYGWTTYKPNSKMEGFKVETFYFLNEKCFKIVQDVEYDRSQLFHSSKLKILKVFLKSFKYQGEQKVINFMTKFKNKMQFSKTIDLHFQESSKKNIYTINQERFEIIRDDKFNLIKNPLSLFYGENDLNDADKYLNKLMNYFTNKFSLQTTNLPIETPNFSDEIDDDLFEQYYLQVQNITDHQMPPNSNFRRSFTKSNLEHDSFRNSIKLPDISFGLIFFKKVIKITNEDNYTKLILNLLNVLSLWFDLGVLDLHCYVYKIRFLFLFTCKLVLEIERQLLIRF